MQSAIGWLVDRLRETLACLWNGKGLLIHTPLWGSFRIISELEEAGTALLKETDTQEMLRASLRAEGLEAQSDRDRKQICGCVELGWEL